MRTRHATVLSVAGVLAAGLVAALVNAQALAGSGGLSDKALSSTHLLGSVSSVASSVANPVVTVVAPSSTGATTAAQRLFSLGEAGVITLDQGPDTLSLLAVTPADGWSVTSVRSVGSDVIVIGFASSNSQLTAIATLHDSNIGVTVATTPLAGNSDTTTSSPIESETIPPDPTAPPMDTPSSTTPIPTPTTQRPPAVRPPSSKPPAVRPPSSQPMSTLPTSTPSAAPPPASTESPHIQPAPITTSSTQPSSTLATPSGAPHDGTAGHGSDHSSTGGSVVPDD